MKAPFALLAICWWAGCAGPSQAPAAGDAGAQSDAGQDGGTLPVCTFGMDQTCNDDASVSSLWGSCLTNGTCSCQAGFEVNPTTGRCRPAGSFSCGDMTCSADEFCVERVHSRDGGSFSAWQCMTYFTCTTTDCRCAISSFVSASCLSPTCQHEGPGVQLRCDDLN